MTMLITTLSTKYIRPACETPPSLHDYKLGFIDEQAPAFNINVVLFYSMNMKGEKWSEVVSGLEKSLEKTLTRFYPLAGRYKEETQMVECEDQGVEFIHAKVTNIKIEDIIGSEANLRLVDKLFPAATGAIDQVTDPLLSIQVSVFEDNGGVAVGVSISHRVADVSTLCTFLNEWAAINQGRGVDTNINVGPRFNSASFFPPRGIPPVLKPGFFPRTKSEDDMRSSMYVTKKISFSESNIRDALQQYNCSKVQLLVALIWKAFIDIDQTKSSSSSSSTFGLPVNLRGKNASIMPNESCGNLSTGLTMESKSCTTLAALLHVVRNSIKNFIDNYSKVRDDIEQVQTMVVNMFSHNKTIPPSTYLISLTSWCKFPFYQVDFSFGKPAWVNCGRALGKNTGYLIDGVGGNGIEAYVGIEDTDVPSFEQALDIKAFAA